MLVVGGVHWLATHHLGVIKKALEREGLDRIRVIMKSLGAGFHQPVDGLHCLSLVSNRFVYVLTFLTRVHEGEDVLIPVKSYVCNIIFLQREQRKLLIHNAGLIDFARRQNYDVVDTFNMTMARYTEFLQGKCACHFHRVRES